MYVLELCSRRHFFGPLCNKFFWQVETEIMANDGGEKYYEDYILRKEGRSKVSVEYKTSRKEVLK